MKFSVDMQSLDLVSLSLIFLIFRFPGKGFASHSFSFSVSPEFKKCMDAVHEAICLTLFDISFISFNTVTTRATLVSLYGEPIQLH